VKRNATDSDHEEGAGYVFADLGLEDADELYTRAQLGFHVPKLPSARKLKQREIASLLGIKQPGVSHMMNGISAASPPTSCWSFSSGSIKPCRSVSARAGRENPTRRSALGCRTTMKGTLKPLSVADQIA
jgi:predicted XRE-type DNA-binding protein